MHMIIHGLIMFLLLRLQTTTGGNSSCRVSLLNSRGELEDQVQPIVRREESSFITDNTVTVAQRHGRHRCATGDCADMQ